MVVAPAALFGFGTVWLAAPNFIPWILGPGWEETGMILRCLSPLFAMQTIFNPIAPIMLSHGAYNRIFRAQSILFLFCVLPLGFAVLKGLDVVMALEFYAWSMAVGYILYGREILATAREAEKND
jgi:O-antigen/teichoic acid export membrane protein